MSWQPSQRTAINQNLMEPTGALISRLASTRSDRRYPFDFGERDRSVRVRDSSLTVLVIHSGTRTSVAQLVAVSDVQLLQVAHVVLRRAAAEQSFPAQVVESIH